jgi:hypothetical protein
LRPTLVQQLEYIPVTNLSQPADPIKQLADD